MPDALQTIIGTDKNNPHFTICRDLKKKLIHVYYGAALNETISEKEEAQIKSLVARLYNSGVKLKSLSEHFGYNQQSIRKWGRMLSNGELSKLIQIWENPHSNLKLTREIESFVIHQFNYIYPKNKYTYSKEIRKSISEVFNIEISSETLRPLFKKLKESYQSEEKSKKKY